MVYKKPDRFGHFDIFGGKYVPETLIPAITELEKIYLKSKKDISFQNELKYLLQKFSGRPTPLYFAKRISTELGFNIYLKREDLNHTGAHKINNALGQILLAKKMNKSRIIAETGAGQHGVATASVAAQFGFECINICHFLSLLYAPATSVKATPERVATKLSEMKLIDRLGLIKISALNSFLSITSLVLFVLSHTTPKSVIPLRPCTLLKNGSTRFLKLDLLYSSLNSKS